MRPKHYSQLWAFHIFKISFDTNFVAVTYILSFSHSSIIHFACSFANINNNSFFTVIEVQAEHYTPGRNRNGQRKFSAWDMFTGHSCDPNMTYDNEDSDKEEDWRNAYATREIRKGDRLTIDYNSIAWDRTTENVEGLNLGPCNCETKYCTGTIQGFKFIDKEAQQERLRMSRLREVLESDKPGGVTRGKALAAHIRVSWRKDPVLNEDAPDDTDYSDSSSSSSGEEY